MKLQAKDLMIGDWIQIAGKGGNSMMGEYHQIDWIGTGAFGLDNKKIRTHAQVEPIPLTPEILEKNGFSLFGESMYVLYKNDNKTIKFGLSFNGEFRIEIGRKWRTIAFIHELQHALKLCGIEKEIEIKLWHNT